MEKQIQLLECTLRDGGLGLEDAEINGISHLAFKQDDVDEMIGHLTKTGADIVELGSIEVTKEDRTRFCIYQSIEEAAKKMPVPRGEGQQMYAAMYRGPDITMDQIDKWKSGYLDVARVIIRYSELQKSMDFCAGLAEKGYKVFVQPMVTMRYTEDEIDLLIRESNQMGAYALYFVDSYGYMTPKDVERLFYRYDKDLDPKIRIGFHAHNNMSMAYANAVHFLSLIGDRKVIVDSTITGMGQGAGNLQTELISDYLNQNFGGHYNYDEVMELCQIMDRYLPSSPWGYSVTRMIPALRKTAYKYSIVLKAQYGLTYREINRLFESAPTDMRQRYTPDNARTLLRNQGYDPEELLERQKEKTKTHEE